MPETAPSRETSRNPRVRARLLEAARELFSAHGYQNTTTRQISTAAKVDESTMFRHFGSKRELFQASIAEPFSEFMTRWAQSFQTFGADAPFDEMVEQWVSELYDLAERHRGLLQSLIAARFNHDGDLEQLATAISAEFTAGLAGLRDHGVRVVANHNLPGFEDPPASIAVEVSMVLGSVLLTDWVIPQGSRRPSRTRMIKEITTMMLHGLTHRAAPDRRG